MSKTPLGEKDLCAGTFIEIKRIHFENKLIKVDSSSADSSLVFI
ncbi:hypothetical protein BSBH6_01566 [Bacillus subtilis]|nr:hypothetical protein BSBH6_01566 [Bacillus subtilis]RPK25711.1 hypothetical protein BH5_02543 [Bacillus subtilis]